MYLHFGVASQQNVIKRQFWQAMQCILLILMEEICDVLKQQILAIIPHVPIEDE